MSWPAVPRPPDERAPSGHDHRHAQAKRVVVDSIAPEDIRFSPAARDEDKASFLGYVKRVTSSDLAKLGLAQEEIDDLRPTRACRTKRRSATRASSTTPNAGALSNGEGDSERPLWLVVAYIRADDDGDGISELLRVVYAHGGRQRQAASSSERRVGPGLDRARHAHPDAARPGRPLPVRPDAGPAAARLGDHPRPARQPLHGEPAAAGDLRPRQPRQPDRLDAGLADPAQARRPPRRQPRRLAAGAQRHRRRAVGAGASCRRCARTAPASAATTRASTPRA